MSLRNFIMKNSLILILVLAGAAVARSSNHTLDLEPEFLPYVAQFKQDYERIRKEKLFVGQLQFIWGDSFNPEAVGVCYRNSDGTRIATISRFGWESYGECQRRELIYHELGHCLLNLKHSENGIMSPVLEGEKECESHWESNLVKLFQN